MDKSLGVSPKLIYHLVSPRVAPSHVAMRTFAHPPLHVQQLLGNLHMSEARNRQRGALRVGRTYSAGQGSHRTVFRHRPGPAGEGVAASASTSGAANAYLEGELFAAVERTLHGARDPRARIVQCRSNVRSSCTARAQSGSGIGERCARVVRQRSNCWRACSILTGTTGVFKGDISLFSLPWLGAD